MRNLSLSALFLSFTALGACSRVQPALTGGDDLAPPTGTGTYCIDPGNCHDNPDMTTGMDLSGGPDSGQWTPPGQGSTCGQQSYELQATHTPPNIHLVIDRSGSMSLDPAGNVPTGGTDIAKWDDLANTLTDLLDNHGDQANEWGMSLFPTSTAYHSCDAGDIAVVMGAPAVTIPNIKSEIAQYNQSNLLAYNGYTPTTAAIQGVVDNVLLNDPTRNNYVVLMTDGIPNCQGNPEQGVTPLIAQLYAQSPPVRTFIIGFGSDTVPNPVASQASNPALLNDWAVAGHTDLPGTTKYYQASDASSLQQAFSDIVIGVASCTFTLSSPPADPTLIAGYIDGVPVPSDPSNGFSYDVGSQSVTFHGLACGAIQADPNANVQIVYGCPPTDAPLQ